MGEFERFFGNAPAAEIARALDAALRVRFPALRCDVQRTQISYRDGGLFCCASRPRRKCEAGTVVVTFGLPFAAPDARVMQVVPISPGRWTHHVPLGAPEEVDAQLLAWIGESHRMCARTR